MVMAQATRTASRTAYRRRAAAFNNVRWAEMPLFQAFLCFSHQGTTDYHCIKDGTPIDPACGSGNFLTETYLSLRRLENEVLKEKNNGQISLVFDDQEKYNPIKVSIQQFYGIEINDFAATVAKTALWIAESQMLEETETILYGFKQDFLPLKTYVNITEGNALRIDWNEVVDKNELNYIMGNPPFHGFTFMTADQKADMQAIFPGVKNLDYVCGWYKKASDFIDGTEIQIAFVSTNSIVQGETVARFWKFMKGDIINFAYLQESEKKIRCTGSA